MKLNIHSKIEGVLLKSLPAYTFFLWGDDLFMTLESLIGISYQILRIDNQEVLTLSKLATVTEVKITAIDVQVI